MVFPKRGPTVKCELLGPRTPEIAPRNIRTSTSTSAAPGHVSVAAGGPAQLCCGIIGLFFGGIELSKSCHGFNSVYGTPPGGPLVAQSAVPTPHHPCPRALVLARLSPTAPPQGSGKPTTTTPIIHVHQVPCPTQPYSPPWL